MSRKVVFPLLLPLLLLAISFWRAGVYDLHLRVRELQAESVVSQQRLDELRALSVAGGVAERNYEELVIEFADLTGLDPGDETPSRGIVTGQVGRLVDAVVNDLQTGEYSTEEHPLYFHSVTPGQRYQFPPFLAVDFELNLEGRFFALPGFLHRLSVITEEQRCAISVGEMVIVSADQAGNTGDLFIVIPLRAYFLAQ